MYKGTMFNRIRLTSAYITSQMDQHPHTSSETLEGKVSGCIDLHLHMN